MVILSEDGQRMLKSARSLFVLLVFALVLVGGVQADITAPGDTVLGVPNDGDWPGGEAPPLAIDDDVSTKYLHFKGETQSTGFQVTPSAGSSVITGLTLTTANDAQERDPVAFALYGSNTSISGPYTLIAEGDIVDFAQATPWPRFTKNETPITFANSVVYRHYQLLFTDVRNAGGANSMQIAEVEFLASQPGGAPPEVDAGPDQTLTWKGAANTVWQLHPTIYDDDPCDLAATDPDYLTIQWSSIGQLTPDFLNPQTDPNAQVAFPEPGAYLLQLQVWDEQGQEGKDTITITVVEPECPPADLSGDCKVDRSDLMAMAGQWLDSPGCVNYPFGCADLAGQGLDGVDLADYSALAASWQEDWTGALEVSISPAEVVTAGARWRVDEGPWWDSGASVADLMPGGHALEFSRVDDWGRPPSQTVQIQKSQLTTIDETYTELSDSSLLISEFMVVNKTAMATLVDGQTVYPDWIEIHNRGGQAMDLSGWYLTDDPDVLDKWAFPSVRIEADGVLLVFASGIQQEDHPENWPYRDQNGYYHTNFRLDADGDYLALVAPDLQVAHDYGSSTEPAEEGNVPTLRADLSYGLYGDQEQYFAEPTPDASNGPGHASVSAEPVFSQAAGPFTGFIMLELSSPNPAAEIRYTADGQVPDKSSGRYTGAVAIFATKEVAARVYEPGKAPSAVVSHTYVALSDDVLDFNSNLPIVLIDTERRGVSSGNFTKVHSVVIDTDADGRAGILDPAEYVGRGGLKVRGSSTGGSAKHQYAFEIWDENNQDKDVSLLGLAAESDWILYAPAHFDRALINNAFVYELSNQIGRYAVRTRFCEVYLNKNNDTVSASDYVGLYILMEKIKRGKDRVDVEKLEPWDSTEPKVTGGYMLKIDRRDPGDSGFRTARGNPTYGDGTLCYVEPKEDEITTVQSNWIRTHLDEFEDALYGANSTDPETGYAKYIDVDSWVDHNLLNMLAMNVDALRLSTFIHKTREGKLEMGPLWDFDRALDSTDGRDNNPQSWHGTGDGTDYLGYVWWDQLFADVNFWQTYIDRWFELRTGPFSTEGLNATIDAMADEIREAERRNTSKWSSYAPRFGGFQGEIDHLQDWLQTRCLWVDSQFVLPPEVFPSAGTVQATEMVTITNPNAAGTIYYTLDGSDPRVPVFSGTVLESETLVSEEAAKRVLVPTGPVSDAWRGGADFDDSDWIAGTGGVGYERSTGYERFFDIDVQELMYGHAASCYVRIPFVIADDPSELNYMTLNIRYDDGFVAYLNGVEIERAQFTGTPAWNSGASGSHSDMSAIRLEDFNVSLHAGLLRQGENVLAIQGLNTSPTSSDLLISAELVAGQGASPSGDGLSPTAQEYTGPFALAASTQIKARVFSGGNSYSPWSGLAKPVVVVGPVAESLRISEVMYHPVDPNAEYIELANIGVEAINLSLVELTDGIEFAFPSVDLAAGEYLLVVRDVNVFEATYGQGFNIAGQYSGSLANGGEDIELRDPQGQTISAFQYSDKWFDVTDGQGFSLTVKDPVAIDPNALGDKASWRPSVHAGGSPGFSDAGGVPELGAVVINEIMANSPAGEPDWIELHNTTDQPIDIGGWFLSDDADALTKYEIAAGIAIPSNGYLVFYQDRHFGDQDDAGSHTSFALSRNGETVYLHSGADGVVTGYSEEEKFDASETGVSLGRCLKSTGTHNFVALAEPTPGAANAAAKVGPVVISEIMYNPFGGGDAEYVELFNISDAAVTLYDATENAPWRLTDDPDDPGVEFLFPTAPAVVMAPGECIVVTRDRAALVAAYTIDEGVQVFAWGAGKLANSSEKVQLSIPGGQAGDGTRHWIRLDRVVYSDGQHPDDFATGVDPWPLQADGFGVSLARVDPTAYGNDPVNWQAAAPSPGTVD